MTLNSKCHSCNREYPSVHDSENNGWLDISTAPKDGTQILVYSIWSKNFPITAFWSKKYNDFIIFEKGHTGLVILEPLSHWQSLPQPPEGNWK